MGTPISSIISDAFRENNLTAVGVAPSDAEQAEALVLLNRYIDSLFGAEMGENLVNIPFGLNNVDTTAILPMYYNDIVQTYLPVNTRLLCNLQGPETVEMPPQPFDGSRMQFVDASGNFQTYPLTVKGNGRNIQGNPSITLSTNNYNQAFFYRADLANWEQVNDLAITDVSPFPHDFDDMLVIGLADRLLTRNGLALSDSSAARLKKLRNQFWARYAQNTEVASEQALIRLPSNRVYRAYPTAPFASWQRGFPVW
ncbi:hypothetical protein KGP36_02990 [Patescibacteria group bacterium]|nr:hypothetical protein [Patescibacteria group bacterium]